VIVAGLLGSVRARAQSAAPAPGTEDEGPRSASPASGPVAAPPTTQPAAPSGYPPPAWGTPPPGWGPPPGYAYAPAPPPYEYPIKANQPLIAGYHVEQRPRQAPITIGLIIGGTAYALGLFAASTDGFANGKGWLVVPVLGPWLTIGARKNKCIISTTSSYGSTCVDDETANLLLGFDGVHQAAGALLVIIGLTVTRSWAVRDGMRVQVLPQFQADRVGVSFVGSM
jgi:hypothetical protein